MEKLSKVLVAVVLLTSLTAPLADRALATGIPFTEHEWLEPTTKPSHGGFGPRIHPISGVWKMHEGVDIGNNIGEPVWATRGGKVIFAGWNGGYGNQVQIDHGDGYVSSYAHLSVIEVKQGHFVRQGRPVGQIGSTGLSTAPHLHFEIRQEGVALDPMPFINPELHFEGWEPLFR